MVYGGKHHLRHGRTMDGYNTDLTESGKAPPPEGFSMVNFRGKAGQLLQRSGSDGPHIDMVRDVRLGAFEKTGGPE